MNHMKGCGVVLIALIGIAGTASAATAPKSKRNHLCQLVQSTSHAWAEHDIGAFERLIGPGFVHIDDYGRLMHKGEWLQWAQQPKVQHKRSVITRDILIRTLGRTAVATVEDYIWSGTSNPPAAEHGRITSVWHRYPEGWKEVSYQFTPIFTNVHCKRDGQIHCSVQASVAPPVVNGVMPPVGRLYVHVAACRFEDIGHK